MDLPKITMRLRSHDILNLLPKDCHNFDISQANLKILVSNHIYTFSPSILHQFPLIFSAAKAALGMQMSVNLSVRLPRLSFCPIYLYIL